MTSKPSSSRWASRLAKLDVAIPLLPTAKQVQDLEPLEAFVPGPSGHSYRFGDEIGSGSVGQVYKATRLSDGKSVAAKHVFTQDAETRTLCCEEYQLMSGLKHDSIVVVEDFICNEFETCLFTEICENGCVQSYVEANGAFGKERARGLIAQLTGGIEYLHSLAIVHCDLKPANIFLLNGAESLKIGDFNSAKRLGQLGRRTNELLSCRGTPLLLAPEVRFGGAWNELVDVWGLGMSAYFMLRAALPLCPGEEVDPLLRAGLLPSICWDSISDEMSGFILLCLSASAETRPSAAEMLSHPALTSAAKGHSAPV